MGDERPFDLVVTQQGRHRFGELFDAGVPKNAKICEAEFIHSIAAVERHFAEESLRAVGINPAEDRTCD